LNLGLELRRDFTVTRWFVVAGATHGIGYALLAADNVAKTPKIRALTTLASGFPRSEILIQLGSDHGCALSHKALIDYSSIENSNFRLST
jgi:hypothetical protein